jgi:hypothetical protein
MVFRIGMLIAIVFVFQSLRNLSMFKKISIILAGIVGLMAMAETASAGVIVDVVTQHELVNLGNPLEYQHNLLADGFVPGTAISGSLTINIYDDDWDFLGAGEGAVITVENFDFDTGGAWGAVWFSAAPGWANDLGISALAALNTDGYLDVQINGIGDFWVGDSTLTIETQEVPEPATLSLLALGLLGLAGISRRVQRS